MRLYTFCNMYLSSIQQGIQAAHLVADMFVTYKTERYLDGPAEMVLYDWAANHKTMICLNGGNYHDLEALYFNLCELGKSLNLPVDKFNEDAASLNGMLTCCGIVVPARIYDAAREIRERQLTEMDVFTTMSLTKAEYELVRLLNMYGLAR